MWLPSRKKWKLIWQVLQRLIAKQNIQLAFTVWWIRIHPTSDCTTSEETSMLIISGIPVNAQESTKTRRLWPSRCMRRRWITSRASTPGPPAAMSLSRGSRSRAVDACAGGERADKRSPKRSRDPVLVLPADRSFFWRSAVVGDGERAVARRLEKRSPASLRRWLSPMRLANFLLPPRW